MALGERTNNLFRIDNFLLAPKGINGSLGEEEEEEDEAAGSEAEKIGLLKGA